MNSTRYDSLVVGDAVRYFTCARGWQFGWVIGRHTDNLGINPSGLEYATVRFKEYPAKYGYEAQPREDRAIPCFLLEKCGSAGLPLFPG